MSTKFSDHQHAFHTNSANHVILQTTLLLGLSLALSAGALPANAATVSNPPAATHPTATPRTTTTDLGNAQAWLPDKTLRNWIEKNLQGQVAPTETGAPTPTITDANLAQYLSQLTSLSDANIPITQPRASTTDLFQPGKITDWTGLDKFTNLTEFTVVEADRLNLTSLHQLSFSFAPQLEVLQLQYGGDTQAPDNSQRLWNRQLDLKIPAQTFIDQLLPNNPHLTTLELSGLGLTGSIPHLDHFPLISNVRLNANHLSGKITALPRLHEQPSDQSDQSPLLSVGQNDLSGYLPDLRSLNGTFAYDQNHLLTSLTNLPQRPNYNDNHSAGYDQSFDVGSLGDPSTTPTQPINLSALVQKFQWQVQDATTGQATPTRLKLITNIPPVILQMKGDHPDADHDADATAFFKLTQNAAGDTLATPTATTPAGAYWITGLPNDEPQAPYSANIIFHLTKTTPAVVPPLPTPVPKPQPAPEPQPELPQPTTPPTSDPTPTSKPSVKPQLSGSSTNVTSPSLLHPLTSHLPDRPSQHSTTSHRAQASTSRPTTPHSTTNQTLPQTNDHTPWLAILLGGGSLLGLVGWRHKFH